MKGPFLPKIDGDHAHLNAQFIVFEIRAAARPAERV
jgi:hypothetical protein